MPGHLTDPSAEFLPFQTALAGRYSIEGELGRGGMGIVFLAREVALDRMVALKLLLPEMAARPGLKDRFLKEARTAAGLSHPNIVPIYAVDEVDGFVFFAMAYVSGGTLGERIRDRGPLSHSDAVRLLREVSWALGYAHVQGVVHRDVKPDNILLEDPSGRALVTDFGIAAMAEDTEAADSTQVMGTAEFMSPEQAKGAAVDARSDLYSLGCVGFYALSGQVPFSADSPAAILGQHVSVQAPTVMSVAPQTPPGVATALDRCLRKDPEQRYSGGEALADALLPDLEIDRELAVPLRVFIKQTRDWESTMAWSGMGVAVALFIAAVAFTGVNEPRLIAATLLASVGLVAWPLVSLVRGARRLLSSGFNWDDGTAGLIMDVERKNEEYRFQVGKRVTWFDKALRVFKRAAWTTSAVTVGLGFGFGEAWWLVSAWAFQGGLVSSIFQEVRARARGDVWGERMLRFWKSKMGGGLFKLAGVKLKRVAPSVAGVHRPTEVVIGLAADRLFAELPKETQKKLHGLPETVRSLEDDAQSLRKQVAELDGVLAEIGDDDPSLPSAGERAKVRSDVETTREVAKEKLQEAVAALETIRLGLLYMHAGSGTVESLTMELSAAQDLSADMEHLLEGHREVERILEERRKTGMFTIVPEDD